MGRYLAELGTPFIRKELSFEAREHKSDWFLKINPMGKLPALTDGDLKLFESGAHLLYIADKYDPSITTSEQRGTAAQWVLFANATQVRFWLTSQDRTPWIYPCKGHGTDTLKSPWHMASVYVRVHVRVHAISPWLARERISLGKTRWWTE